MTRIENRIGEAASCRATIDFDLAQAILASHALPLGTQRVPLARAGRRCLAEPVHARIDSPRRHTAAMDGYAVRASELNSGRRTFRVAAAAFAGEPAVPAIPSGGAVRVMTGAAMPAGLDQVIVAEQATRIGDEVRLTLEPGAKRHVRRKSSDFERGEALLPAGRVVDARAMAVAAAADVASLTVWRQPRMACLASGDELVEPGSAAGHQASVPDSLSEAVLLLARQWGAMPAAGMRARDDVNQIASSAHALLEQCDVLVVIGGAARGERDLAKAGLRRLGLEIAFADVAIKPGKPVWYGRVGERHVLGLPGNPTAAMTTARLFLAPLLTALGGRGAGCGLIFAPMPLAGTVPFNRREQFLCATRDGARARVIERQSASMQAVLADADLLVRIPAGAEVPCGGALSALRF